jgi:dynactin complex subunit
MGYPQYIAKNGITVETRGDNQGALALVKNPHLYKRSKYIDVAYYHIRDLEEKNRIRLEYVNIKEIVADSLTKPLARIDHERFVSQIGLRVL